MGKVEIGSVFTDWQSGPVRARRERLAWQARLGYPAAAWKRIIEQTGHDYD
jgi:hypothetical protein